MSITYKKNPELIVVISNLTKGGAVVYMNKTIKCLKRKYKVKHYKPMPYVQNSKNKLIGLLRYFFYTTIYLSRYYKKLGIKLSQDKKIKKAIVFQDSYIKTPNIFKWLTHKSLYIFHEPPREFYENILLHSDNLYQIAFNMIFRLPIFFIDRINMAKAENIVSNSYYSKSILMKIYGKKSTVVYPGFSRIRYANINKKNNICISVGSLMRYKGHDMVIKSIGKISENRPQLIIVGNGSSKRRLFLEDLAKKNGVKISIYKNINDSKLVEKYKMSHTYVNGSQNEPFGLTSLEAIGYGCSLVTNNTGGTKELLGFFRDRVHVCENNIDDMSLKICISLNQKNKTNVNMKSFSWERVANDIDKI